MTYMYMRIIAKVIVAGLIWYCCHKYIRKGLNPKVAQKWDSNDELDARLGGLAAATKEVLKWLIWT